jgi:hypothetical protein
MPDRKTDINGAKGALSDAQSASAVVTGAVCQGGGPHRRSLLIGAKNSQER